MGLSLVLHTPPQHPLGAVQRDTWWTVGPASQGLSVGEERPTQEPKCKEQSELSVLVGQTAPPGSAQGQVQWSQSPGSAAGGVWVPPEPSWISIWRLSHGWLRENGQAAAGLGAPAVAGLQEARGHRRCTTLSELLAHGPGQGSCVTRPSAEDQQWCGGWGQRLHSQDPRPHMYNRLSALKPHVPNQVKN